MPPYYIHSGVNRPDLVSLLDEEQAMGMVNIQAVREPRLQWAFRRFAHVPLFLDSGLRYKMDIESYLRTIEHYGHRFTWISNLDCLFDQRTSDDNYRRILSRFHADALRSKILWVYQGGSLTELDARARDHALIGIGGSIPRMIHDGVGATLSWLLRIGDVLHRHGTQAHIFGIGNKTMLTRLSAEPWVWGCDSSKWLIAYRYNLLLLPNGTSIQIAGANKRECAAKNIQVIQRWIASPQSVS